MVHCPCAVVQTEAASTVGRSLFIGRSDAQLMGSLVPKVEEEFNGGLTGCQRGGSYRCYVS